MSCYEAPVSWANLCIGHCIERLPSFVNFGSFNVEGNGFNIRIGGFNSDDCHDEPDGPAASAEVLLQRRQLDGHRQRGRPAAASSLQRPLQRRRGRSAAPKFQRQTRNLVDAEEREAEVAAGQHHLVEDGPERETKAASQARNVDRPLDVRRGRDVFADVTVGLEGVPSNLHDVAVPGSDRQDPDGDGGSV